MTTADGIATCWVMIDSAAQGVQGARDDFVMIYAPLVQRTIARRWRHHGPLRQSVEDALQEVFLECFRRGGILDGVEHNRPRSFRGYLCGVVANVTRRFEARWRAARGTAGAAALELVDPATDGDLVHAFEREWARGLIGEALAAFARSGEVGDARARARVELLRLRFEHGLPIREIARRWSCEPAALHHEYARARREVRHHLTAAVARHGDAGTAEEAEAECRRLIGLLS